MLEVERKTVSTALSAAQLAYLRKAPKYFFVVESALALSTVSGRALASRLSSGSWKLPIVCHTSVLRISKQERI